MKIAFIGQKGIPAKFGGIERHVEEVTVRLAKKGHDVYVYTRPWYTNSAKKQYKEVKLISLPSIKTKHLDAISHTLFASIHASLGKFDVIHYHGVGPSLLAWIPRLMLSKSKIIITFHCLDRKIDKWGFFAKLMLRLGEWTANKLGDETITVSKTLQQYCKHVYGNNAKYIPNGISKPVIREPKLIKNKFNLDKNSYIFMAARLIRSKGAHYLIDAYKQLDTDKKLVITGDSAFTDNYVAKLLKMGQGNPNIIFTGFQSGEVLQELFSNAYIMVLPSESEGLSVAILEGMSYKKCVLVSDIDANKEAISDCGKTFSDRDADNLALKLQYLIDNPEIVKKIGEKAQGHAYNNYNWDDIVTNISDLYREVKYRNIVVKKDKKQELEQEI